jgi:hypothetical protein
LLVPIAQSYSLNVHSRIYEIRSYWLTPNLTRTVTLKVKSVVAPTAGLGTEREVLVPGWLLMYKLLESHPYELVAPGVGLGMGVKVAHLHLHAGASVAEAARDDITKDGSSDQKKK